MLTLIAYLLMKGLGIIALGLFLAIGFAAGNEIVARIRQKFDLAPI